MWAGHFDLCFDFTSLRRLENTLCPKRRRAIETLGLNKVRASWQRARSLSRPSPPFFGSWDD